MANRKLTYCGILAANPTELAPAGSRGILHSIHQEFIAGAAGVLAQSADGSATYLPLTTLSAASAGTRVLELHLEFDDGLLITTTANDGVNVIFSRID